MCSICCVLCNSYGKNDVVLLKVFREEAKKIWKKIK